MKQQYDRNTQEDQGTWGILYRRQKEHLIGKALPRYLTCLDKLSPEMNETEVADFRKVVPRLQATTGWDIEVVKGLIPVEDFFELLADKKFPSSTWLRSRAQLDYLEEPDMFHDTFGHIPMIIDEQYAAFMEAFGKLGVEYIHDASAVTALQRLYWFSIEFGVIEGAQQTEIYGAGILSSFGEVDHIYTPEVETLDFDLEKIIHNHFVNSEIQMRYYKLRDMDQLYRSLAELKVLLEQGLDIDSDIIR